MRAGEIFLYRNWVVASPMFYCIIPVWSVLIDYQAWVVTILAVFAGYSVRQKIEPLAIVAVVAAWCATRFYLFQSKNYPEYPTGLSIQTLQTKESADALEAVLGKSTFACALARVLIDISSRWVIKPPLTSTATDSIL